MRGGAELEGFDDILAGGQIAGSRPYQEDDFRVTGFRGQDPDDCDLLMVLADGMGGHYGGGEASRLAVSAFVETFPATTGGVAARLRVALTAANEAVGRFAAEHVDLSGMGCTLVACVVTGDEAVHWISVGDSPLWRLRAGGDDDAGGMDRLNADHSMRPVFENLVRLGRMAAEDAEGGAVNQLRSAVTGEDLALVDAGAPPVRLGIGDRILLASDGLEALSEEEIHRLSGGAPASRRHRVRLVGGRRGAGQAVAGQTPPPSSTGIWRQAPSGVGSTGSRRRRCGWPGAADAPPRAVPRRPRSRWRTTAGEQRPYPCSR